MEGSTKLDGPAMGAGAGVTKGIAGTIGTGAKAGLEATAVTEASSLPLSEEPAETASKSSKYE